MLSPDGTVLECLPGYWNPQDLLTEMRFANDLNNVWLNPKLSRSQKEHTFTQMHLAHLQQHPAGMVKRSKMQGFDQKYEAEHRLNTSDTIAHPEWITPNMLLMGGKLNPDAFKTTDEIMHERMSARPFLPIAQFDVANYVEYGKPKYDKHEDARFADGSVNKDLAKTLPTIGNTSVVAKEKMMNKRRAMQQASGQAWGNSTWGNSGGYGGYSDAGSSNGNSHGYVSHGNAQNSVRNY